MKKRVSIIFILLFSLTYVSGQTKQAVLQNYFSTLAANGQFNGNILVAEKGRVIYEESFGYADFEKGIFNKKNTPFPIASLSKTLTATAILQLEQTGKLNVSHPVKKYLSWFPYESVTIRHLLSHTSGLPPYNAFFDSLRKKQPETIFTNADFKDVVVSSPKVLLYQPGEKGNYDNVNFVVLALLIEYISGTTYSNYIAKHVLQPANMTETRFVPFRVQYTDSFNTSVAHSYLYLHRYSDSMVRAS
jgi:CubicO group peptidase (beta-lactamase class C family)